MTESLPVASVAPALSSADDLDIPLRGRGPNRRQGIGWKRERDEDRVELIDDDDAAGIGRLDHVAGVDQAGSGAPVER